jgi:hypothetical protein
MLPSTRNLLGTISNLSRKYNLFLLILCLISFFDYYVSNTIILEIVALCLISIA